MPSAKSNRKTILGDHRKAHVHCTQVANEKQAQRTIAEHFAASKQGIKEREPDDLPGFSPSKRLKRSHIPEQLDNGAQSIKSVQVGDMYNFSNNSRRCSSEAIDLISSPNGSPMKKIVHNGVVRRSNISSSTGPKKLVVKNLKRASGPPPEQYYNDVWKKLDASLTSIFQNENVTYSKETLYTEVMIVCRQNKAPDLHTQLQNKFRSHVDQHVRLFIEETASTKSDAEFLSAVINAWTTWSNQLEDVRSIFYFLDRSYLLQSGLPSISQMGIDKFQALVFEKASTRDKVLQGACDLVKAERTQGMSHEYIAMLQDAIKMFHVLAVYNLYFESRLLAESQQYYSSWVELTSSSTDLAGYIEMCDRMLNLEMRRSDVWALDATTKRQLELYLEDMLIEGMQDRLLKIEDVEDLLSQDRAHSLRRLYLLLQRRQLGGKLRPAFEAFIIRQGSEIVFDETREQEMVVRLLDFKKKLDQIWESAFEKHVDLGHTLREAFETFINKSKRSNMTWGTDNPKPGEMIAKYVDMVLKDGAKAIRTSGIGVVEPVKATEHDREASSSDEDIEITKQLDQVLELFRFVHGKAVFEAFYKRDLARRLLLGRSASSDAEKSMLTRLKSECGAGFTHNLEQMFKDIEMARDEITSYKVMLEERNTRPVFDLSVNVLSSSAWPSYPNVTVNVPEDILKATANFEQHYKTKYSGRKLEWKHALAHCQLKSSFPKGAKEIVVSSFQAIVLLSFNNIESMTYSDLQSATGLDDIELKRTLQSLACAKYRVLSKHPKGKDVYNSDTFSINNNFQHPKYRIKINQIQAKETKQENKQTHERVAADRAFETQAAIVRIMKSRKTITHAELVSEVISATRNRGPLDPADIKTNIEKLIEKDYMERDEEAHNSYSYVA